MAMEFSADGGTKKKAPAPKKAPGKILLKPVLVPSKRQPPRTYLNAPTKRPEPVPPVVTPPSGGRSWFDEAGQAISDFFSPAPGPAPEYVGNRELKNAPQVRVTGPVNRTEPQQGSAKSVRTTEFKPSDLPAMNEFQRTNALRKRDDLKDTAWIANPNKDKDLDGVVDRRDAITLDDYLDLQDRTLKTALSYQGGEVVTVKGKDYRKLSDDYKLIAQHNTLLDELLKLDTDMYGKLDTGGAKDADGNTISDERTTWAEAGDKTKQKGARKAFEAVHGRAPTAEDTFTPNLDAYLNLAGVKGLDLYTGKGEQDIVNDLYIATDEVDAIRSGNDFRLGDDQRDRLDVANDLFSGIQSLQDRFTGSEGVVVSVGDDRATSDLDITKLGHDQRVNLAMIIGTSIMDEDPEVLLELNSRVAEGVKFSDHAVTPNTHAEDSPYAKPGMGGLKLDLLADPKVREELESYRTSLDAVMEDAKANGVSQEEVFKLMAGKDLPDIKAAEFLDYIDDSILPKTGELNSGQLQEWIKRQNELFEEQKTKGPDGTKRLSVGGDENLREMLMGGKATVDSAVQQATDKQSAGVEKGNPAKPELQQRVAYLRDQARYQGQELIDLLVAEGYDEAAARNAVAGG